MTQVNPAYATLTLSYWTMLMAGALVSVIPVMILFIVAQRYFVRGVTSSGLKG